jgi:hypothetical protein
MNIFQKLIQGRIDTLQAAGLDMLAFSRAIEATIGVKAERGQGAKDMAIDIPGFTLNTRCGNVAGGWHDMWVVMPLGGDGNMVGYVGDDGKVPKSWDYRPAGTATTFCPPKVVREKIIGLLRDVCKKETEVSPRDVSLAVKLKSCNR